MSPQREPVVLIVEDKRDLAEMYREWFTSTYDVRVAYDGEEGLEKLDDTVDVVLLDRKLPRMSGDDVLAEIRSRNPGCRILMVTAVEPALDLLVLEFDEYLVKPVTEAELLQAVERMLAWNEMEARIQDLFSLASKLATLETKLDLDQLKRSETYEELLGRFETLRDDVDLAEIDDRHFSSALIENLRMLLEGGHADPT